MPLDNRLSACAEMVSGKGTVVDVGTDHGYLPVFLVSHGICKRAVAADINQGPLKSAKEHISSAGLDGSIITVLSDGLDGISSDDVSDVLIAGMGGELIAEIIERCSWLRGGVNLILQPMTKIAHLRSRLWDMGFEILRETACFEGFFYTVMLAKYTGKKREYSLLDTYIGKTGNKTDDERGFLKRQSEMLAIKGRGMLSGDPESADGKLFIELSRRLESYANGGEV